MYSNETFNAPTCSSAPLYSTKRLAPGLNVKYPWLTGKVSVFCKLRRVEFMPAYQLSTRIGAHSGVGKLTAQISYIRMRVTHMFEVVF